MKGLVLLLAVAACCLIGVDAGKPPPPHKCKDGYFPTESECYKHCNNGPEQYDTCRKCKPKKYGKCWKCVCLPVYFGPKVDCCSAKKGYECPEGGSCYKYDCVKGKDGWSYCKKVQLYEVVSMLAKKDCGDNCPPDTLCCYLPDKEHDYPWCEYDYECNLHTYECEKKKY